MSQDRETTKQKTQEKGISSSRRSGREDPTPQVKLLTCETWVTRCEWFIYALQHPDQVPFLLIDRSPCMDPFLDPYAPSEEERRPLISGLCRGLTNFEKGDIFIYITPVAPHLHCTLKIQKEAKSYLGVAVLKVIKIYDSHVEAATTFERRRYVMAPDPTLYPPNLAHDPTMPAAILREHCIVSLDRKRQLTPDCSTDSQWHHLVNAYHKRQKKDQLCVAECRLLKVDSRYILQLDPLHAPVFTAADWGGKPMNQRGKILKDAKKVVWFCQQIAHGR